MTDATADRQPGPALSPDAIEIWDTHELDGMKFGTPMNWMVKFELDEIWTPMNWMESRKKKFGTLYTEFLLAQEW